MGRVRTPSRAAEISVPDVRHDEQQSSSLTVYQSRNLIYDSDPPDCLIRVRKSHRHEGLFNSLAVFARTRGGGINGRLFPVSRPTLLVF